LCIRRKNIPFQVQPRHVRVAVRLLKTSIIRQENNKNIWNLSLPY
jgi:hypothetical protein